MQLSLGGSAGGASIGEPPAGRTWLRVLRDRAMAFDPGLVRLIAAGRAVLAIATALGLEYLLAGLLGGPPLVPLMLGAVLAMLSAFGVLDPTRGGQAVTMGLLPVFMVTGMGFALLVDSNRTLSLSAFVLVVFVAVYIRRFGPRFFICGMVGFMGYFFALFLGLRPPQFEGLLPAVALATVWVVLLSTVLVPIRNDRVLRRMIRSFEARLADAAGAAARLAASTPDTRDHDAARERVRSRLVRLNETALTIDGQLGAPGAVLDDALARTVRRALFDGELAAVALVEGLGRLDGGPACDPAHRDAVAGLARAVQHGDWARLRALADRLADDPTTPPAARGPAADAVVLAAVRAEWTDALAGRSVVDGAGGPDGVDSGVDGGVDGPDRAARDAEFEPAVQLFAGNLPGSAGTVSRLHEPVAERAPRPRFPRLSLTTRQAVQAAVATAGAVAVGDALSTQRYYWAVLAAFIAFTGTATVAETVSKSVNRIVGTMIGLLAAIPLVPLIGTNVAVVMPIILLSIFGAFYLFRVSYALMIFFITMMLGELYSLLGSFTVDLMVLRLEETAAGGAIGCLVAVLVLPSRTRAAVDEAQRGLLDALAGLLGAVDVALRRRTGHEDLRAAARAVDATLHQALLIGRPLGRTWMLAPDPRGLRRLTGYSALAHHARHLARTVYHRADAVRAPDGLAALTGACSELREIAALAADGRVPARGRPAAVADLLAPVAGSADDLAPLAREAGLLAAELEALLDPDRAGDPAPSGTGRILGPDHEPFPATVTLVDRTGRQDTRTATGDDGRFTVTPTAPGTYLLVASPRAGSATPHGTYVRFDREQAFPDVLLRPVAAPAAAPPRQRTRPSVRPVSTTHV